MGGHSALSSGVYLWGGGAGRKRLDASGYFSMQNLLEGGCFIISQ